VVFGELLERNISLLWCSENCWNATFLYCGVWRIAGTQHVIVVMFCYVIFSVKLYGWINYTSCQTYPLNARCESMYISNGMKLRATINAICDTLRLYVRCERRLLRIKQMAGCIYISSLDA
jgi:hypothetical protein